MKKSPVSDRFAKAEKRGYDTGKPSKGHQNPPAPKVSVRPTGGLKMNGVKAKIEKKF